MHVRLGQEDLRQYQLHLLNDCKLTSKPLAADLCLRFFFLKALRRSTKKRLITWLRRRAQYRFKTT